ncbi:MAG: glycosyltransferase [Candidatus Marinimicrobia bacterium]|jgi:glycosyltransferase involved in cell wall biosynthesis|nr:glycosyltransferase [Candidatus Neomarinimicrobiota bacterium]MBT3630173.1 glycosyltransferase [Candidatus Neomarinimicrobiota bacterium]MBT3826125.1 glycosyltransferase [Candidatus Neomarinimicrobiota bacterium]MBT4132159.1 glycosyltransferase [Candidatus Neomarinimicrobiota bacterium]MBT4296646.1 glycosyltransferase [Candidatus Neomarinimicrobiota bacterium]
MPACDLSIVLPVNSNQENLDRILLELSANSPDVSWEVIVVDDGSSIALQLSDTSPDHWNIYRNENRQGAAVARNIGVKHARGEFIILLSVFLKIPDTYIDQLRAFIKNHHFDIAQHLVEKSPNAQADYFQVFLAGQKGRVSRVGKNLPVKNTQFGAAIFKKEMFVEVGGFDETMNHYGGHELDLAYRLDQKGYSTRVLIEDLSLERVKLETHSSVSSRLQEYGRIGLPALLKKHPELKKTILLYPQLWYLLKIFGISKGLENRLNKRIEQNVKLSKRQYRLYLHLLVRNAWDAR